MEQVFDNASGWVRLDGTPMLNSYTFTVVLMSAVTWEIINQSALHIFGKNIKSQEVAQSIAPFAHSIFATISVIIAFLYPTLWMYDDSNINIESIDGIMVLQPHSYVDHLPIRDFVTCVSFGFFLWDLTLVLRYSQGIAFMIHAIFCTYVYAIPVFLGCFQRAALLCLTYEFSTIFLRLIFIFEHYGYNKLEIISQGLFAIVFLIVRILYGSYITFELWNVFIFRDFDNVNSDKNTDIRGIPIWTWSSILVINALFHCLNLFWFSVIIGNIVKFYKSNQNKAKE